MLLGSESKYPEHLNRMWTEACKIKKHIATIKGESGNDEVNKFIEILTHRAKFLLNMSPALASLLPVPIIAINANNASIGADDDSGKNTETTDASSSAISSQTNPKSDPEMRVMKKISEFMLSKDLDTKGVCVGW